MELMMATLAVSYPGYFFLSQAPHTRIEMPNRDKAAVEMILVKNHISLSTTIFSRHMLMNNMFDEHILLNGSHLELGFTGHSDDAPHDGFITYGEYDTGASPLNHESRRKS